MHYVYILESTDGRHWYVGITWDLKKRLLEHNAGDSLHTKKFKPWRIKICVAFSHEKKAVAFEKYLKSHAGRAFTKKHF